MKEKKNVIFKKSWMFPMEGWKLALELGNLSRWCKKNGI
jgi:hypothetical protein